MWINWNFSENHMEEIENIGHSNFSSLFQTNMLSKIPVPIPENFTGIDACMLFKMRFGDVRKMEDEIISLDCGDFWGSALMLNPIFKKTKFGNLNIKDGFPLLFRSLFTPLKPTNAKKCSWFFQYRYVWPPPYSTASFDHFLSCASSHGFTKDDYDTTYIITDDPLALVTGSSLQTQHVLAKLNFIEKQKPRRGVLGDVSTIDHMYALSSCKHAVLTGASSFGVCIAGLANVQTALKVTKYGDCVKPKHLLLDPNAQWKYGSDRTAFHDV
jgi:hypothetical protein